MAADRYVCLPRSTLQLGGFFFLLVLRVSCSIFRPASSAVVGFSDQPFSLDLGHHTPQLLNGH